MASDSAMHEAFRRALAKLEPAPATAPSGRAHLEVVRTTVAPEDGRPTILSPAERATLAYRLRKLARHWCSYTNPGQTTARARAALQDEWLPLAGRLASLSPTVRADLLHQFVGELEVHADRRQRQYLSARVAAQPERWQALRDLPGVTWPSLATFVVHTLAELEDCSREDCQQLPAFLARFAPADPDPQPGWLLAALGDWLEVRRRSDGDAASAPPGLGDQAVAS